MKIRPVGAELFHSGWRTYRHAETNSRFPTFCKRAQKIIVPDGIRKTLRRRSSL